MSVCLRTFVLLLLVSVGARYARGQDAVDRRTRDVLEEIDASTGSATRPASRAAPEPPGDQGRLGFWELFLPMLATAAAVGISASVLGTFVLLRREALMALAMPQVVAAGVAIGMRLGWPRLPPALVLAGVAAVYFALSKRWGAANWVLPAFYVGGISLSFLVIAGSGEHVADLQNVFVGIDVAVTPQRAMLAVPAMLLLGLGCAALWRRWLLVAQAPAAAELAGVRPARWDVLFLSMLTAVLLVGTDSLGVVMVLAMLFLPAAAVLPWVRRIPAALLGGVFVSLGMLAAGFWLSNRFSWPLSHSVGGVGFALLVASHAAVNVVRRPVRL